ncbi:MAG: ArdC family protein [Acidiferrobacteraceae bacterium]
MNTTAHTQTPESQATSRVPNLSNPQGVAGKQDIHQQITDQIIAAMEQAQGTGKRLWDAQPSLPLNLSSGKPYQGINVLILWCSSLRHGYTSPYWLTYKQAADMGGQVRKGEHGELCVFYKPWEQTSAAGETETKKGAVLKSFRVFNLDQITGIEAPAVAERPAFVALQDAERILSASQAQIHMGGTQAFYRRTDDTIHLPERERFTSPEAFYSVALHEMCHSTGHSSRLDRTFGERFGDDAYAMEELVAEMGSAFLTAELGILTATLANHADYLSSWLKVLKQDKRAILTAAAAASKAHGYIKGLVSTDQEQDAA